MPKQISYAFKFFPCYIAGCRGDDILERHWLDLFDSQIASGAYGNVDGVLAKKLGDIPIAIVKGHNKVPINTNNLQSAETPKWVKRDSSLYKFKVTNCLKDIEYDSLYTKFTKEEGYSYLFPQGAYTMAANLNIVFPKSADRKVSDLLDVEEQKNLPEKKIGIIQAIKIEF